jgi:hypothetical protein
VAKNTNYHLDSWLLAMTYDAQQCITTGIFCVDDATMPGSTTSTPDLILKHLTNSKHLSLHPMLLPIILFSKLLESSKIHRNELRRGIQDLEAMLGEFTIRRRRELHHHDQDENSLDELGHRVLSHRLTICRRQQAARDGRNQFWKQFKGVFVDSLDGIPTITDPENLRHIHEAQQELLQVMNFKAKEFQNLEGRDVNFKARIEAQAALVSSAFPMFGHD